LPAKKDFIMTTRNLNRSTFSILVKEYTADLELGSPHPIRYLKHDRKLNTDIYYEIAVPVDISTFKKSLSTYILKRRLEAASNDGILKTWARSRPARDEE
jgi:hypothetical protein